ncbi:MAG: DNA adenine methylase [Betaproteobacteria bacterium]
MKTPLRYPGGKSRAVETIMPYIRNLDCGELCSPFLGGGSIELKCSEEGMTVHGYDLFQPLVWFWQALLSDPERLISHIEGYRENVQSYTSPEKFIEEWGKKCSAKSCKLTDTKAKKYCSHHKNLNEVFHNNMRGVSSRIFGDIRELVNKQDRELNNRDQLFRAAAQYYIVNRTSFSGATTSGGWSWKASWARLTDSAIKNLLEFQGKKITVSRADFKDSINAHPDAALYLDPPYSLNKEKGNEGVNRETLYGTKGDHHKGFDHVGLANILKSREKWVLSYSDCEYIRELYDGYEIVEAEWKYGMNNSKESSEILILG